MFWKIGLEMSSTTTMESNAAFMHKMPISSSLPTCWHTHVDIQFKILTLMRVKKCPVYENCKLQQLVQLPIGRWGSHEINIEPKCQNKHKAHMRGKEGDRCHFILQHMLFTSPPCSQHPG
jgi:hypothetical protein